MDNLGLFLQICKLGGDVGPHVLVSGSGFRVQGSGFRVQGSGFRVQGSGFRVQGSGVRVWDSGLEGHSVRGPGVGIAAVWVRGERPSWPRSL